MMIPRKRLSGRTYPPSKRQRTSVRAYRGRTPLSTYQPRAPQGEWKFLDQSLTLNVDTTGTITLLNGLAPGTSASQRVGTKIAIRSLELRGRSTVASGAGIDQGCRFFFLLDKQSNGAAPAAGDFLAPATYLGMRNLANRKRFKILQDYFYPLSASGEDESARHFKVYIKFRRPLIVDYNAGTAGSIADIASNGLFLITLGSVAAGGTAAFLLCTVRMRYTDM